MGFDVFAKHFSKSHGGPSNEMSTECFRAVLCRGRKRKVTLESFNKCLSFFGPLEAKGGQALVDRIVKMCEKPFFHGDIEKDEAVKLLSRQKKCLFPLFSFYYKLSFCVTNKRCSGIILGTFLRSQ